MEEGTGQGSREKQEKQASKENDARKQAEMKLLSQGREHGQSGLWYVKEVWQSCSDVSRENLTQATG